uniref:Uncharacterized protein n=1 Tax=Oryza sativa subsp. japonica TaxID=39947 RepID=Q2QNY5_ORYSJ|nr:hypothetical protein LOC_Os12g36320 [Oryza sativa Japonica Group]
MARERRRGAERRCRPLPPAEGELRAEDGGWRGGGEKVSNDREKYSSWIRSRLSSPPTDPAADAATAAGSTARERREGAEGAATAGSARNCRRRRHHPRIRLRPPPTRRHCEREREMRGRGRRDGAERAATNEGGETGRRARPQPLVGERTPPPPLVGSGGRAPPQSLVRGKGAAAVAIRSRQRGGIGGREEMKFKVGINLNRPFNQTALASLALGRGTIGPPNWSASLG